MCRFLRDSERFVQVRQVSLILRMRLGDIRKPICAVLLPIRRPSQSATVGRDANAKLTKYSARSSSPSIGSPAPRARIVFLFAPRTRLGNTLLASRPGRWETDWSRCCRAAAYTLKIFRNARSRVVFPKVTESTYDQRRRIQNKVAGERQTRGDGAHAPEINSIDTSGEASRRSMASASSTPGCRRRDPRQFRERD